MSYIDLLEAVVEMDIALTGKDRRDAAANARHQSDLLGDLAPLTRAASVYYLSDFGYSRIYMRDGQVFLTENSKDAVRRAWETPEAQEAVERFRLEALRSVGVENPGHGMGR